MSIWGSYLELAIECFLALNLRRLPCTQALEWSHKYITPRYHATLLVNVSATSLALLSPNWQIRQLCTSNTRKTLIEGWEGSLCFWQFVIPFTTEWVRNVRRYVDHTVLGLFNRAWWPLPENHVKVKTFFACVLLHKHGILDSSSMAAKTLPHTYNFYCILPPCGKVSPIAECPMCDMMYCIACHGSNES